MDMDVSCRRKKPVATELIESKPLRVPNSLQESVVV